MHSELSNEKLLAFAMDPRSLGFHSQQAHEMHGILVFSRGLIYQSNEIAENIGNICDKNETVAIFYCRCPIILLLVYVCHGWNIITFREISYS